MASYKISEFKNALRGGGARPNQFEVFLSLPGTVSQSASMRDVTFLVQSAQLPGSQIGQADVFFRGRRVSFAGERVFDTWTVTVLNDVDFRIRKEMEQWVGSMGNNSTTTGETDPTQYMADPTVSQLDREGNVRRTYKFFDCFPVDVSPIELSMDDNDNIERYTVTFQVAYWTVVNPNGEKYISS